QPPNEIEPAAPTFSAPVITPSPTAATIDAAVPTRTDTPSQSAVPQATVTTMDNPTPLITTPVPTAVLPDAAASMAVPLVSSLGRLAVVQEHVLFVETAVGSANLVEIARNVAPDIQSEDGPVANPAATWSPDGSRLAFFYEMGTAVYLAIWDSRTEQIQTLPNLVNKALPPVPFTSFRWSPEGNRLLLTTSDRLTADSEWTSGVWIATLDSRELTLVVEARQLVDTAWLNTGSFFLQLRCGHDCATIMAYDVNRRQLWKAYEEDDEVLSASTFYALNIAQGLLVNLNNFAPQPVVDVLDTVTGELTSVWQLAADEAFALLPPHISPNGRFLTFNTTNSISLVPTLHLIDRDGRDYGSRDNATVLDWRPNGGPVVVQAMGDNQNQLVYWPLDGAAARIFVQPRAFTFPGGQWRADGQYFIYSALDPTNGASYLYLWSPEQGTPFLIFSAAATQPFQDFAWAPDGQRVFFTLGGQGMWAYDLETGQVQQISVMEGGTGIPPDNPN
ncbi:MAG: PD40 domain-containing protein, partial [Anaerolineales bacterium]|nr:PD40 domain-containing protein [Anaerolineales bacterium]